MHGSAVMLADGEAEVEVDPGVPRQGGEEGRRRRRGGGGAGGREAEEGRRGARSHGAADGGRRKGGAAAAAVPAPQARRSSVSVSTKPERVGLPVPTRLSTVVFKNKFVDLDPTHIRFGLRTLQVEWGEASVLLEVEVHHSDILEYYEEMGAFYHYYFFRSRLEDATVAVEQRLTPTEIDEMLERVLLFLVEASGVPVLLSMLVLIFASGGEDLSKLPANRLQLYTMATECAVKRRLQAKPKAGEAGAPAAPLPPSPRTARTARRRRRTTTTLRAA